MLLPIRPICNRSKIRRDGTSLIQIQYCFSSEKKTLLSTGIAIPPNYWSRKSLCILDKIPQNYGCPQKLNAELKRLIRLAEDIVIYATTNNMEDPIAYLKSSFKVNFSQPALPNSTKNIPKKQQQANIDLFFQIEDYITTKRRQVTPNMIHVYENMRDTLKAFETFRKKTISFESFDCSFYEEFVDYMMYDHVHRRRKTDIKGFKMSTIGKTIKQLRIFLRNRIRRKIIAPINLEEYKILDEETDSIYLTIPEIAKIFNADLSLTQHLSKYRDLFVFGCLTGLRFSDFTNIQPEEVRNGVLHKKQKKSNHWVVIPLRIDALNIFKKNCEYFSSNLDNGVFNYYIKEIGKLAGIDQLIKSSYRKGNQIVSSIKPKFQMITSHTCRRSFCTNEFLSGTPVELIMKISGHKSLRDFYKYIRISQEEAGQKIREIWNERGDLKLNGYTSIKP